MVVTIRCMAYALVTTVDLGGRSAEEQTQLLETQVVPVVKGLPGFEHGMWARSADGSTGIGIVLFESEEHATSARDGMGAMRPADAPPITGAEIYAVLATS